MKTNVYRLTIAKASKKGSETIIETFKSKKDAQNFLKSKIETSKDWEIKWTWNIYNKEIKIEDEHIIQYIRIKN